MAETSITTTIGAKVMLITPKIAEKLLERNTHNRSHAYD